MFYYSYLTLLLGALVVFSAGLWYAFISLHKYTGWSLPNASTYELFGVPAFWALVLLVPVIVCLRDFLWKFYRRQFCPHGYHIVQELKLVKPSKKDAKAVKLPSNLVFEGTNRKPKRNRGFSFSQTFGQSRVLQAYGQSPRLTSSLKQSTICEDDI